VELTFLGTSAGVPTRRRNVSALALRPGQRSRWVLFDCGEATQHQIMKSSLSLFMLERIFITHLHGDHIYGIFGLLASRGMLRAEGPLEIYGPEGLREMIETVMRLSQLHLPFELSITEISAPWRKDFGPYRIDAVALSHSIPCYGYCLSEAPRPGRFDPERARRLGIPEGPLYGALQRGESVTLPGGRHIDPSEVLGPSRPGIRVLIGGDNDRPELFAPCTPADLMIHEATYTQADFDKLPVKFRHTTARALGIAAQRMGIPRLVATHFSPRYDSQNRLEEIRKEIQAHYRGEVILAEDLMQLKL